MRETIGRDERVTVPGHLMSPRGGEHFVLRVIGNDMIEEAITDGDYVIVLRREAVEPGEMAVVHVGDEATIKRVYPEGPILRLVSANPAKADVTVRAAEAKIAGVVVGLMRKL